MNKIIYLSFLLLFIGNIFSQESKLKLSKLGDPKYFENYVKYIPDEILFESMNLDYKGLEKIKKYVEEKNFQKAYEEWGKYWNSKEKLDVIADLNDHFISKSDFLERYNENKRKEILIEAEKLLNNEIMGWGKTVFKFGDVIDFNANYGDSGKYGFHYFIWSRPLYLSRLITKDKKYTDKYDQIFSQWYDQRYRVSYVYPEWNNIYYELGLGMRNVYFIFNYCDYNENRSWIFHEKILKTMLGSGNWLYQMIKNEPYTYENRQLVAISMLGMLGIYFPEFVDSKLWVDLAYEKTLEHLEKDFFEDGSNIERSPNNYTVLTYNCIRNFYYLLKLVNYDENKLTVMKDKLVRTINYWIKIIAPNGDMFATNDCQRTKLSPNFFIDAIKLYGLKDVGFLYTIYGLKEYANYALPKFTSVNLPISSYAIMRTDWNKSANYMAINYGSYSGGHSHYDILSFDIYALGKSQLIEASMGWTYDDTLHSKWYKNSLSHNMIVINDSTLDKKSAMVENTYWMSNDKYDFFTGEDNKGYSRFGVSYSRDFLFLKPNKWLIYDYIKSSSPKNQISTNFHLRGKVQKYNGYFKNIGDSGLVLVTPHNYSYLLSKGKAMIKNEKKEDDIEELEWIRFFKEGEDVNSFCTLIYPFTNESFEEYNVKEINNGFFIISKNDTTWEVFFNKGNILPDNIITDARCIVILKKNDKIVNIQIIDGSYLTLNGEEYIKEKIKGDYEK